MELRKKIRKVKKYKVKVHQMTQLQVNLIMIKLLIQVKPKEQQDKQQIPPMTVFSHKDQRIMNHLTKKFLKMKRDQTENHQMMILFNLLMYHIHRIKIKKMVN